MSALSFVFLTLCCSAVRVHASCAYGTHLHARQDEDGSVPVNKFGYTGAIGPLNWLSLDPVANVACATGRNQSPIDMTADQFSLLTAASVSLVVPDIAETEIENLGTTVEVVVPAEAAAGMTVNGTAFSLKQFHYHLPSEHLDDGRSFAMEMHMVFESAVGEIAVLGVYLDTANGPGNVTSAASAASTAERRHARDTLVTRVDSTATPSGTAASQSVIDAILSALGLTGGAATAEKTTTTTNAAASAKNTSTLGAATGGTSLVDTVFAAAGNVSTPGTKAKIGPLAMSGLIDSIQAGSLQSYKGSLTTPPCSEGVSWFVSTQKQTVSLQTFETARNIIGFNSRFPQNKLGQDNLLALAVSTKNGVAAAAAAAAAAVATA
ncbi:carbonic anhydrase, alpha-class [Grosmannia clavigera kw1407]|uniref:carbonic anhydrase n=1 Tax=Grosmannia clavigera (strain kw1407 / UAMH 11150) TaxID=655863 RepID=F0XF53_GROCL|nr:carbonic anhydrase, alpha-class [Grosmannia clavigera kw1407]EFX04499.1 carbonic anhydrase, alpha-class [Grosmannia clavigera kw1407]